MPEQDILLRLKAVTDESSFNKASKSLDNINKTAAKGAKDVEKHFDSAGKAAADFARDLSSVKPTGAIQQTVAAMDDLQTSIDDAAQAEKRRQSIFEQAESQRKGAVGADFSGDVASSTAGLRGAVDALSGGSATAITSLFEVGEAFADIGEFGPKFAIQLGAIGQVAASSIPIVGQFAGAFTTLIPGLSAGAAGLAGMAAAALPFVAIAAALAIGIGELNRQQAQYAEQIKNTIAAQANVNKAIREGATGGDLQARIKELQAQRADEAAQLAKLQQVYRDNIDSAGALGTIIKLTSSAEEELVAQMDTLQKSIGASDAELNQLTKSLNSTQVAANSAAKAIQANADVYAQAAVALQNNDPAAALAILEDTQNRIAAANAKITYLQQQKAKADEELAALLQSQIDAVKADELTPAIQALTTLNNSVFPQFGTSAEALKTATQEGAEGTDTFAQSLEDLAAKQQQAADAVKQFNDQRDTTSEDRRIKQARDEEDWLEARQQAHDQFQKKITDIETQGQAKIASIRDSLAGLGTEQAAETAKAQAKANDAIAQVNAQFMQSELAAAQQFQAQETKAAKDFAKNRLRAIQDLNDNLLNAEAANDVTAFLQAQQAGEKELARQKEDADTAAQERITAYLAEREAARQARDERLAEVGKGLADELVQIQANTELKRAQLTQQLADEQAALQTRLQSERAAFAESEALANAQRQKRLQREMEDQALQDKRAQEALAKRLAAIDGVNQKELSNIGQLGAATDSLLLKAQNLQTFINNIKFPSALPKPTSNSQALGQAAGGFTSTGGSLLDKLKKGLGLAFANEGIATGPTVALLGENLRGGEAEAVVKFNMARGLPDSILRRAGGATQNLNLTTNVTLPNATIGDVASGAEVSAVLQGFANDIAQIVFTGLVRARFQPEY